MRKPPFRLNRSGLVLALVSAAFAGEAGAAAGRVEFVVGGVTVTGRDGQQRPLARGTELDNGDTVRTNDGRAQIRFTDGAYTSLQPNTEFGIRDYRYDNRTDGSERGFFGLLRGAMRTVTGAIGRINRDRYQVQTPTATVGIRGTGGVIQVQDDGSTLVIGTSGIWSLTNPAGSVDVPAGTSAVAPSDPNQPPQETTQAPTSGPAPVQEEQPEFVAGEERDDEGNIVIPTPRVLVSGTGFFLISAFNSSFFEGINVIGDPTDAVFDGAGQMTSANGSSLQFALLSGGSHGDFGTDGILAWGRWIGPVQVCSGVTNCSNESYTANEGFHYVIGMPTPVLPTSGGGTYTLAGATRPTYQFDQSVAPGTFSGTLNVLFGAQAEVTANFNIAMPDGKGFGMVGSNRTITTADWTITPTVTGSGGACSSGCTGFISGFFAGASAERVGVGYHINEFIGNDVIGAAAFQKP